MEIIRQVQNHISRGELSEALNSLKGFAQGSKHYNLLIALEAQLSFNQKNILLSTQSYDVNAIERNRITHSILEISALVEHEIVSTVEESKIYLYKASAHSYLKDSYAKQFHLEKLKRTASTNATKDINQQTEYLQLRIEKLEKINKRLTIIIGLGILTSLIYELYVAKLIKDFLIWDKLNSHISSPEINAFFDKDFELNAAHEIVDTETDETTTNSNHDNGTFRAIKPHEIDHHHLFLHGAALNALDMNNELTELAHNSNMIELNHEIHPTTDFDIDTNT